MRYFGYLTKNVTQKGYHTYMFYMVKESYSFQLLIETIMRLIETKYMINIKSREVKKGIVLENITTHSNENE